uniref:Uncharacterized protein n=1 Tax=Arundo donax TaxID=35708 RepID=A0A0A9B5Z6_ARUDO
MKSLTSVMKMKTTCRYLILKW